MNDITADIARYRQLASELEQMRRVIASMVPESPRLYEPTVMALDAAAQAVTGCNRAAYYLQKAAREVMGGE